MNSLLVRNARVIDPSQQIDAVRDVLVLDGRFAAPLDSTLPPGTPVVDGSGKWVCPGFVDLRSAPRSAADFTRALMAGITTVCRSPESAAMDSRLTVLTAAPLLRGEQELGEVPPGARALSTGFSPVKHLGVLRRALQYARPFGLTVMLHSEDASVTAGGVLAEGPTATLLGLAGVSAIAETAAVAQILELIREVPARVHLSHLTTARSLQLVADARRAGLAVTCDATVHHLTLDDTTARGFSLEARVWPPLRSRADVTAMLAGVREGTVDAIAFDDVSVSTLDREHAFAQCAPGRRSWDHGVKALLQAGLEPRQLVAALTLGPARILGLDAGTLKPGAQGDLCLLNPATGMSDLTLVKGVVQFRRQVK